MQFWYHLCLFLVLRQKDFILDKSLNILFRLASKWALEAIGFWQHLGLEVAEKKKRKGEYNDFGLKNRKEKKRKGGRMKCT